MASFLLLIARPFALVSLKTTECDMAFAFFSIGFAMVSVLLSLLPCSLLGASVTTWPLIRALGLVVVVGPDASFLIAVGRFLLVG